MATTTKEAPVLTPRKLNDVVKDFMASAKVAKDPNAFCRADALIRAFKDYCKESKVSTDELTLDHLTTLPGVTVEKDTYLAYPGPNGSIQKSTWAKGVSVVADNQFGADLTTLLAFLDQAKLTYDTSLFMKYSEFLKVFEAYCLTHRKTFFKPSGRVIKEICTRKNLAVDASGVRKYGDEEPSKGKWLLGVDFEA